MQQSVRQKHVISAWSVSKVTAPIKKATSEKELKGAIEERLGSLALTVAVPSCWRVVACSDVIFGRDFLPGESEI
jgi:hypothetical protein